MRYSLLSFFMFFLICGVDVSAQTTRLRFPTADGLDDRFSGIRFGLFADNGVHPGLKLGTSFILREKEKARRYYSRRRKARKGDQVKIIEYLLDGQVGVYNHPNNHLGAFAGLGFTRMRTNTSTLRTLGLSLEANYLRRSYNIPTVELSNQGGVLTVDGAGTNGFMFALAPSFGKLLGVRKGVRVWHIYAKPSVQFLQYDFGWFPNAALELGMSVQVLKK